MPDTTRSAGKLFEEFPPVSTEQWEAQIRVDLEGREYGEVLLWHTKDGLTARPYYREEDLARLAHIRATASVEFPRSWLIRQDVRVTDIEVGRKQIRDAIDGGVEMIGLRFEAEIAEGVPERLFEDLSLDKIPLHLDAGNRTPHLLERLHTFLDRPSISPRVVTTAFDPLGEAARTGYLSDADFDGAAKLIEVSSGRDWRTVSAGVTMYHEAGAGPVLEAALVLATVSEYLVLLIDRGLRAADALQHLFVSVPIGTSYFLEVAKLRAIRILLPQLIRAFNPGGTVEPLPLHAVTSERSRTLLEPSMNLLRATTEACAAIVGGCDVLAIEPFDNAAPVDFSFRLARNIQLILRHEAHLDKVSDPGAGSYYLESLTDAVAQRAWQQFKEIEAGGGLLKSMEKGEIQRMIEERRDVRMQELAHGRRVLVGTNRYAAPGSVPGLSTTEVLPDVAGRTRMAHPLPSIRDAAVFERIRARTAAAAEVRGEEYRAIVIGRGDPAVRASRESMAADILTVGGFVVEVHHGDAAFDPAADLIVYAAPDEMYPSLVAGAGKQLFGLVAEPTIRDFLEREPDLLLYRGCDMVETLSRIQNLLGLPE